jgi:septum site-determining protein MinC
MNTDALALDFKSATLYAVRIVLHSADLERLNTALDKRMTDAGALFENEPVVIDASQVQETIDWPALLAALQHYRLPAIGVMAEGLNLEGARAAGLVPVALSMPAPRASTTADGAASTAALTTSTAITDQAGPEILDDEPAMPGLHHPSPPPSALATTLGDANSPLASALVITKPLRSGQRVYARHTDLVVIGMVSQGAEVIADGNVHVYGPLRGKAMAGARGDTSARIFTTQLDAELLAVAGVYRVVEAKLDGALYNQPAVVWLEGQTLSIEAIKH